MKKLALLLTITLLVAAACRRAEQPVAGSGANRGSAPETAGTAGTATPAATSTAPVGIEVGSTMPEYSAMWLDGSKFELAGRRDKVVLLNIWATWCGPCRYEIPELQKMHDQYASKGFEVIGVSVDESGVEAVRQFVDEQKMTYPIALDPEGRIASLMQTSVLPTTVLVDRSGRIVWKKYGLISENDPELKKAIEGAV
ncbi:MAG TPA: TlpA disulfide reductase family protein [Thermoanaerobaculia bacterium]|nr:TlpA disulfide reductase family protein [Thermoanaerobaculia bacterium]